MRRRVGPIWSAAVSAALDFRGVVVRAQRKVFIWRSDLHACGEIIVAGRAIHALRADGGQKHFSAASKKINKIYSEIESALNLTHMPNGALYFSPGLRGTSYPGNQTNSNFNPDKGCVYLLQKRPSVLGIENEMKINCG